jgi:uroporphyrinogen III methyltransferase/synthase
MSHDPDPSIGKVYLVGAGPGDPELITRKGQRVLATADVIVYDRLANPRLLRHARPEAERIYVGKRSAAYSVPQTEITDLLLAHARRGRIVCRLKGGDPFVFGRGGEEAEALVAAGIPFEVVPGVSSAIGVPAYAGIPVTHRGLSATLGIVTGHEDASRPGSLLHWEEIAGGMDTIVFLMGVKNLPHIVSRLLAAGRSPETPIALIRWGSYPGQETVTGTLATILDQLAGRDFGPPAVTVVGEVVRLRERLRWFDQRPLFGRRVLVTRSREQASSLVELLEAEGAEAVELPLIRFEALPPPDPAIWKERYDWLIVTSANTVTFLWEALRAGGQDMRALRVKRIAAVGEETAAALEARGLCADFVPTKATAGQLLAELTEQQPGVKILLPRAEEAPELLPEGLRAQGADVRVLPLYRTVPDTTEADGIRARIEAGEIDAVTFASSSTVKNFCALFPGLSLSGVAVACIGPVTAATAQELGLPVTVVPEDQNIRALVRALAAHLGTSDNVP